MSQSIQTNPTPTTSPHWRVWLLLAALFGWSYTNTFEVIAARWTETPEYSHAWIVPIFSLWLILREGLESSQNQLIRKHSWPGLIGLGLGLTTFLLWRHLPWPANELLAVFFTTSTAWILYLCRPATEGPASRHGLILLTLGLALRLLAAYYYIEWFDHLSLIPVVAGLGYLLIGGPYPPAWRYATLFLTFSLPLPFRLEHALKSPLRGFATRASTYLLQTLGFPAYQEGYLIIIGEHELGVTDACSGLRMFMVFAALTVSVALILQRPWWFKVTVVCGFPLIALLANVIRILITSVFLYYGWEHLANMTFHDLAGVAMMPLGVLLLLGTIHYLDRLIVLEIEHRVTPYLMKPSQTDAS